MPLLMLKTRKARPLAQFDDVKGEELLRETHNLLRWYITLVLLRLMDYSGEYANRLAAHGSPSLERVPWTK